MKVVVSDIIRPKRPSVVIKKPKREPRKFPAWILVLIVILVVGLLTYLVFFPKVEIKLNLKEYLKSFEKEVIAVTDLTSFQEIEADFKIPAQLFFEQAKLTLSFPATGTKEVSRRAEGVIRIYNSYSSRPQGLKKNTLLVSSDGKGFRLKEAVIVPGAQIVEGKIVPSFVEAEVIAEAPGQQYNIGPQEKFTIPGLKKYPGYFEKFWGKSTKPMQGGFVGKIPVATPEDLSSAKQQIEERLKNNLVKKIFSRIPKDLKIFDQAREFKILEEEIGEVNSQGKFSMTAEGSYKVITFNSHQLRDLIIEELTLDVFEDNQLVDYEMNFKNISIDFGYERISFQVLGKAVFKKKIDLSQLKQRIAGKDKQIAMNIISSQPGLASAEIKIKPFFVKKIPSDLRKINIKIQ